MRTVSETITIKRYNNRKLYDTSKSRYTSLVEIANYLREYKNVVVLMHETQLDVTRQTLKEVFNRTNTLGVEVLSNLIRGV